MSSPNNRPRKILPEHKKELKRIGNKLKELRERKEKEDEIVLSKEKLTEKMGVSRNNYYLVESGKVYFKIDMLITILKYYDVSLVDFFKSLE